VDSGVTTARSAVDAEPAVRPLVAFEAVKAGAADMSTIREAAHGCQACDLFASATQTVFGEGAVPAQVMLVGEQPGDREDLAGRPFVGPAGQLLDEALERAGIDRERVFVTNVVKHFKWRPAPGGKRRLHEKPNKVEVGACLPWVQAELALVRPHALVLLGSTAAAALVGPDIRVTRDHGKPLDSTLAPLVIATIHPSAVLRSRDAAERQERLDELVGDLRVVAGTIADVAAAAS
jgi:uracil-DNA glycosylase family protein